MSSEREDLAALQALIDSYGWKLVAREIETRLEVLDRKLRARDTPDVERTCAAYERYGVTAITDSIDRMVERLQSAQGGED